MPNKKKTAVPIFDNTLTVKYYPTLEHLHSNEEPIDLKIKEIEEKFAIRRNLENFEWTNNPYLTDDNESNEFHIFSNYSNYSNEGKINLDHLAICFIDESIGYAVVANSDIPEGAWILFNGVTKSIKKTDSEDPIIPHNCYISFPKNGLDSNDYYINAENTGGFSSLILASVPSEIIENIDDGSIPKDEINNLASSNFNATSIYINNIPQTLLTTNRKINKGELLVADYGKSFFLQFSTSFIALKKNGSRASDVINKRVNEYLQKYILNRNISNLPENDVTSQIIKNQLSKLDSQQLIHRNPESPRVFINQELFIVYPTAIQDILELAELFLIQKSDIEKANNLLKSASLLNEMEFHADCTKAIEQTKNKIKNYRETKLSNHKNTSILINSKKKTTQTNAAQPGSQNTPLRRVGSW